MKIAFISFEYPPDAAYGGIATYVHQAARMLCKRGHHIEIFTSSPYRSGLEIEDNIMVHRINEENYANFPGRIGPLFAKQHAVVQFDVLEGPEYSADASEAVRLVPDIPLVVKLHTPTFLTVQGTYDGLPFLHPLCMDMFIQETRTKARMYINALLSGCNPSWRYTSYFNVAQERSHALETDVIAAPSKAIADKLIVQWSLNATQVSHVPYPYIPSEKLLMIPVKTYTNVVTFLGRLEIRKGVLDLAQAIPLVLRRHPTVKFRFVGPSEHSPKPHIEMQQYLEYQLRRFSGSVEFTGPVAYDNISTVLAATDVCVFPSIWENFPNVCLEAMAAARGIVGSGAGGMAEMLDYGKVGRVIPPRSPKKIAEAVIELLEDSELRIRLGQAARDRLLVEYCIDRIAPLQEASYARAIERRRALGPRLPRACNC